MSEQPFDFENIDNHMPHYCPVFRNNEAFETITDDISENKIKIEHHGDAENFDSSEYDSDSDINNGSSSENENISEDEISTEHEDADAVDFDSNNSESSRENEDSFKVKPTIQQELCATFPKFVITFEPVVGHFGDKTWNKNNFCEIFGELLYYCRGNKRNEFLCPFCVHRNTEKGLYQHLKTRHCQGPIRVTFLCDICAAPLMANSFYYHQKICFGKPYKQALKEICSRIDDKFYDELDNKV